MYADTKQKEEILVGVLLGYTWEKKTMRVIPILNLFENGGLCWVS